MTDTPDLSVLRAAAKAATPGGWHTTRTSYGLTVDNADEEMIFVETHGVTWTPNPADAEFIAAADPATVLALIDRLAEVEEQADPGLWEQMTEALRLRYAARAELAALDERITALADEWESGDFAGEYGAALSWCAGRLRAECRPAADENGDGDG